MDSAVNLEHIFPGDSEMARLMRAFDWSTTAVGMPGQWPESLKAAVRICVTSRSPMVIWWGKTALTQIYNDAYMHILTPARHPQWLGRSGAECWGEHMGTMSPLWQQVLTTGEAIWREHRLSSTPQISPRVWHNFTCSYNALQNDDAVIDGILCICHETTRAKISDRPQRTPAELTTRVPSDITKRVRAEAGLARELEDAKQLQKVSSLLIHEENSDALYDAILDAAMAIMRAEFGFIHLLNADRGELQLIASRGFQAASAAHWQRVSTTTSSICSTALQHGERIIAPDVNKAKILEGTQSLLHYKLSGINAVQCTPLTTREGRQVGMISTHWPCVHKPGERELRWLDILARQAADFVERRRARDALRRSEEQLRLALSAGEMGTWKYRIAADEQFLDEGMRRLAGLPSTAECMPLNRFIEVVHENDRARLHATFGRCLREGAEIDIEFRVIWPDRSVHWLKNRGKAIKEEGRLHYLTGTAVDITARKRTEEELRRAKDQLERRVAERTAELTRRSEQLQALAGEITMAEQRERHRLAELLHDHLQQLLVAARFRASILMERDDPEVHTAARKIDELLRECLAQSSSLTAELSPALLHEDGLDAALNRLTQLMADHHDLAVTLDIAPGLPPLSEQVRVLLYQSVRELLLNVVKHSAVRAAHVNVRMSSQQLSVEVSDAGKGFDSATLLRKGQPQEGRPYESREAAGFGLFSIGERIDLLGGEMILESQTGKGCRITLTVPVAATEKRLPDAAPPPQHEAEESTAPVADKHGRVRVLIADDHAVVREGLVLLLAREPGLEIVGQAADGPQAVELARALHPSVVLMDISMPNLSGLEATRQILAELPDVRVIGLTMVADTDRIRSMREAGAIAYIDKSGPSSELLNTIRACVKPGARQHQKSTTLFPEDACAENQ